MTRAVKNRVNVECFADDREKDSVGKAVCKNATNFSIAMNDPKQFRIILRATCR